MVLSRFINQDKGFYVDVGAHHPKRYSNTYLFYKKGWNGINIDAMPGLMDLFKIKRPRDINLEAGISNDNKSFNFYIFFEAAFNTFSKELADSYVKQGIALKKVVMLETRRLSEILDKFLPKETDIDFLTIDAEGFDMMVLESNNWDKYQPKYILVEALGLDIEKLSESTLYNFLKDKQYYLIAKTFNTLFFKHNNV